MIKLHEMYEMYEKAGNTDEFVMIRITSGPYHDAPGPDSEIVDPSVLIFTSTGGMIIPFEYIEDLKGIEDIDKARRVVEVECYGARMVARETDDIVRGIMASGEFQISTIDTKTMSSRLSGTKRFEGSNWVLFWPQGQIVQTVRHSYGVGRLGSSALRAPGGHDPTKSWSYHDDKLEKFNPDPLTMEQPIHNKDHQRYPWVGFRQVVLLPVVKTMRKLGFNEVDAFTRRDGLDGLSQARARGARKGRRSRLGAETLLTSVTFKPRGGRILAVSMPIRIGESEDWVVPPAASGEVLAAGERVGRVVYDGTYHCVKVKLSDAMVESKSGKTTCWERVGRTIRDGVAKRVARQVRNRQAP